MKCKVFVVCICAFALLLTACGQTGPLRLPRNERPPAKQNVSNSQTSLNSGNQPKQAQ